MPGLFQSISAMAGTDMEKAADLAQHTFHLGLRDHGHHGRAFIETLAELCRNHPNIVGIGVGLLVEQLLAEDKRQHDRRVAQTPVVLADAPSEPIGDAPPIDGMAEVPALVDATGASARAEAEAVHEHHVRHIHAPQIRLHRIRPGHLAFDVFGGLLLLKVGLAVARLFRRKKDQTDGAFTSVSKIHLLSATIATYYFARALSAPKVSAWRNAAIALFGTDAIKPLLKPRKPIKALA